MFLPIETINCVISDVEIKYICYHLGGGFLMETRAFECKRGELTIRGRVFLTGTEPRPAVVLCHGFLANMSMCRTYAKLLAELGYASFLFDFCGGGLMSKSDGKSEDMSVLTEVQDLLAVIREIRTLPFVIPERVSLLGCSQGGLVSAMVARDNEIGIERLVLLYPALCIPDDARRGHMLGFSFDPENIPNVLCRLPMRIGGDYARAVIGMDVYKEIKGYEGPVLYLQGTEDRIVDISYARKAGEVFPQREYHEIQGAGHMFRGKADREACDLISGFMSL